MQERLKTLNVNTLTTELLPNTYALGYDSLEEFIADVHCYGSESMEFDYEHAKQLLVGAVIVSEIRAAVYKETGNMFFHSIFLVLIYGHYTPFAIIPITININKENQYKSNLSFTGIKLYYKPCSSKKKNQDVCKYFGLWNEPNDWLRGGYDIAREFVHHTAVVKTIFKLRLKWAHRSARAVGAGIGWRRCAWNFSVSPLFALKSVSSRF